MRLVQGDETKMEEHSADIHVYSSGRTKVLHHDCLRRMGLLLFVRNENCDKAQNGSLLSKTQ
jgi:hypothetical protein